MQILTKPFTLSSSNPHHHHQSLSSKSLTSPLTLLPSLSTLSLSHTRPPSTIIRMGGGPRTYPGGVSKWQWKRMQAKKSKQLLKARLTRERQIYEMRKRAELKAAVSELERPWEVVRKAAPASSALFSVSADDQLKVLADRFQKPGGFDMWTENDGPQIFTTPDEGLPTARFFPKGVVHSIRPYGRSIQGDVEDLSRDEDSAFEETIRAGIKTRKNGNTRMVGGRESTERKLLESDSEHSAVSTLKPYFNGENNKAPGRFKYQSGGVFKTDDQKRLDSGNVNGGKSMDSRRGRHGVEGGNMSTKMRRDGSNRSRRQKLGRPTELPSEDVYDMRLQGDGNYSFIGSDQDGI